MILETLPQPQTIDTPLIPPSFIHLVTLVNRTTAAECVILVETMVDSFCEVLRETNKIRFALELKGYEIFEAQLVSQPF